MCSPLVTISSPDVSSSTALTVSISLSCVVAGPVYAELHPVNAAIQIDREVTNVIVRVCCLFMLSTLLRGTAENITPPYESGSPERVSLRR